MRRDGRCVDGVYLDDSRETSGVVLSVRDRTHAIMALLNDDAALQAARAHAAAR